MSNKYIIYEKMGKVARLTLNRPKVLNAMNEALLDEMDATLIEAEHDDKIGIIIIKGAERNFSVGMDIEQPKMYYGERPMLGDMLRLQKVNKQMTTIWNLTKPVIAQVHGYCLGAATDLAGQCDIIIAAQDARFGRPEVRLLGIGWLDMIAYNAGLQWTKILMYTGDTINGKVAERIGLIAKAVPARTLEEEVNRLAERIALVPYDFVALHKKWINRVVEQMGLANVLNAGMEANLMGRHTKPFRDFTKLAEEQGLKAALAKYADPFKKAPKPSFLEE